MFGSLSDPRASCGETVSNLIVTWFVPGCWMIELTPLIEAREGVVLVELPGFSIGAFTNLYVAPMPPAKPIMKIAAAKAGANRIWFNQWTGSKISRDHHPPCSAVSKASCRRMRDAARKLALGSCTGL